VRWEELLDDARADDVAAGRSRARWLARQAEESATFVGVLLDLAEHGYGLVLTCAGGRRVDGVVRALGVDVVVLDDRAGDVVVVPVAAIAVVRPAPDVETVAAAGRRTPTLDVRHEELLGRLVDDRPDVSIALVTGDAVAGTLVAVGADVLTVRVADGGAGLAYVALSSVASTRFRSG